MSESHSATPPMGEPGKHPSGTDLGGMRHSADAGLGDALQRSTERADDNPAGPASTGDAATAGSAPRVDLGGTPAPGSGPGAIGATRRTTAGRSLGTAAPHGGGGDGGGDGDEQDALTAPAAADPDEPRDESAAASLGRAVSEIVTGPVHDRAVDRSADRR